MQACNGPTMAYEPFTLWTKSVPIMNTNHSGKYLTPLQITTTFSLVKLCLQTLRKKKLFCSHPIPEFYVLCALAGDVCHGHSVQDALGSVG